MMKCVIQYDTMCHRMMHHVIQYDWDLIEYDTLCDTVWYNVSYRMMHHVIQYNWDLIEYDTLCNTVWYSTIHRIIHVLIHCAIQYDTPCMIQQGHVYLPLWHKFGGKCTIDSTQIYNKRQKYSRKDKTSYSVNVGEEIMVVMRPVLPSDTDHQLCHFVPDEWWHLRVTGHKQLIDCGTDQTTTFS